MTPEALLDLFLLSPAGLIELSEDGGIETANLAARRLLAPFTPPGSPENLFQILTQHTPDLLAGVHGSSKSRGVIIEQIDLTTPSQDYGICLSLVRVADGRLIALVNDASKLVDARRELLMSSQRRRAIETSVRDYAFYSLDGEGRISSWSVAAERVHQWQEAEIIGKSMTVLLPSDQEGSDYLSETLSLAGRNGWCEEEGYRQRQDGTTFWSSTVITALRDASGATVGYSVISRDVSERRRLEESLRDDATGTTDYLTGVMARRAFFDMAQSEVARARRYGQPLTMLLIDPDHFRELVTQHGDGFGNEWLRAIAWVSRQESRNTDVVGRVGGEAFAVLLPSTELSGGLVLAERIRERMQRHIFGGDYQGVRVTLSIGVAEVTDSVTSVDGLLSGAGTAVERARQAGRNLVVGYD